MHGVVRSFRSSFVEGRFIPLLGSLLFIAARYVMFISVDTSHFLVPTNNYLWNPLAHWMIDPTLMFIASTASVFIVAWLISFLNSRFNLIRTRTNLPFIAALFLFSMHPSFLIMSGDWIAIIFILLAFFPFLESYQRSDSYLYSFRSGVLIGIASLFQVFSLLLMPLWWRGERAMRGGQTRSFVSSLFGLFLIYISLFSVYLLKDNLAGFVQPLLCITNFSLPNIPDFSVAEWFGVLLVGLYFIINISLAAKIYSRDKVLTLTYNRFAVFLIVFLLLLQVLYWEQTHFFLTFSIALIAYLTAYLFTRTQSRGHIFLAYGWGALLMVVYLSFFSLV